MIEIPLPLRLALSSRLRRILRQHLLPAEHVALATPAPYTCIVLTACGFALLAALFWEFGGYHSGFLTLNTLGRLFPDSLWSSLTLLGDTQVAFALLLFVLFRYPQLLPATLIAAIPATLISHGLKQVFSMARPAAVLPPDSYHLIGSTLKHGSFPSGHSTTAGVIAALFIIIARNRVQRGLLIALLTLVIFSRVMVAAHWPIDVLIGAAIGLICGLAGYELAVQYRCCRAAGSQWLAMLLPFYAVLTLPFHDGGYPLGHGAILVLALIASARYLQQLQQARPPMQTANLFGI